MRIKSVFQIVLIVNWCLTCVVYFLSEPNTWVNLESLVYLSFLTVILSFALATVNRLGLPLMLLLTILVFQKYCLSPFYLMLVQLNPATEAFLGLYSIPPPSGYNVFLGYSVLGLMVTTSGLLLGTRSRLRFGFNRNRFNDIRDLLRDRLTELSLPLVGSWYLLLAAIIIYQLVTMVGSEGGAGVIAETLARGDRGEVSLWYRIFLRDSWIQHLILVLLFFNWETMSRRSKLILLVPLLLGSVANIVLGSRSVFYKVAWLFLACSAVKYGDYVIKGKWFRLTFVMGVVSVLAYPLATAARTVTRVFSPAQSGALLTFENLSDVAIDYWVSASGVALNIFTSMLSALTSFETGVAIMNNMNINPIGDLLSLSNIVKRVLNNLWIGEPFPGVMSPQFLFDHIYFDRMIGFNAHNWGIWEQFYLIFGYWGGVVLDVCHDGVCRGPVESTAIFQKFFQDLLHYHFHIFLLDNVYEL